MFTRHWESTKGDKHHQRKKTVSINQSHRLYGRVPFTAGGYPDPIIVLTTTTTTTTSTSTTTTTTTTTQSPPVTPPRLAWTSYYEDTSEGLSSNRADVAIVPLEEQEGGHEEVEWGSVVENGESPSLKDGTIRLTGGRDDAEGNVEVALECNLQ